MALAIVKTDRLHPREALQSPGQADGRVLPAGKHHQRTIRNEIRSHRSIPLRRPGPVNDTATATRKPGDLLHLRVRQIELQVGKILRQSLDLAGARDHRDAFLGEPAQTDLCSALAMSLTDASEYLVHYGAAARDRTIGNHNHAVPFAGGDDLVLVEEWVALDLIADQRLARHLDSFLEQRHREIRHTDLFDVALVLYLGHGAQCLAQRYARVRPVDQQEIDGIELQLSKAFLHRAFEIGWRQHGRRPLGGG